MSRHVQLLILPQLAFKSFAAQRLWTVHLLNRVITSEAVKVTDRRLRSWLSGAVLTTWSLTRSKQWRWSWTSGETPCSPPLTIMNSSVTTVESFRFLGTTISQDLKWDNNIVKKAQQGLYFLHQLRKFNLPQELLKQFICHHWIRPLHINNCLVQLSYQIWPRKNTEGSPDCWANRCYNPPHSPGTALIQSEQKGCQNHSGPLTSSTLFFERLPSGRRYRALSTRTTRYRNSFFPQVIHLMNTWQ